MRVIRAPFRCAGIERSTSRYACTQAEPVVAGAGAPPSGKRRMADGSLNGTTADQRYSKNVNARNHILARIVPRKNVSWQ